MAADLKQLEKLAKLVRYFILVSSTEAGSGHPTSSLSATDLTTALFFGGFLKYDLKEYINKDRELYFEYDKVTPGPKVSSWDDLIPSIDKELKRDSYKKMRQKIRHFFHTYTDGNSSKRIAEKIHSTFVK